MFFDGPYLRVLTPETTDGINLLYVNDKKVYRESHLPLSAQKHLERKNMKLPDQLKHKIEVVGYSEEPEIKATKKTKG